MGLPHMPAGLASYPVSLGKYVLCFSPLVFQWDGCRGVGRSLMHLVALPSPRTYPRLISWWVLPFHSQEWSATPNFFCSLARNIITPYSRKNLNFHSLFRWKMPILTTWHMHFILGIKVGRMHFLNLAERVSKVLTLASFPAIAFLLSLQMKSVVQAPIILLVRQIKRDNLHGRKKNAQIGFCHILRFEYTFPSTSYRTISFSTSTIFIRAGFCNRRMRIRAASWHETAAPPLSLSVLLVRVIMHRPACTFRIRDICHFEKRPP